VVDGVVLGDPVEVHLDGLLERDVLVEVVLVPHPAVVDHAVEHRRRRFCGKRVA
jgi:hypothetical protein